MKIEVIETKGTGNKGLFINVLEAIKACGINGKVELVNDIQTILKYGIRATPTCRKRCCDDCRSNPVVRGNHEAVAATSTRYHVTLFN